MRWWLPALLIACAGTDSDGDGLSDAEERRLGSDPYLADTDGDGLNDGDEVAAGADPTRVDTDGDGYTDRDEVHEGHDPADADDRIYIGNWPYRFDKDELDGADLSGVITAGERFARLVGPDQHGDEVDLYDFVDDDVRWVVVDLSAQWCEPCIEMSAWLTSTEPVPELEDSYGELRTAVDEGELRWITVVGEGRSGEPPTAQTADERDEAFSHPRIPVLADTHEELPPYLLSSSYPTSVVLGADLMPLRWVAPGDEQGHLDVLDWLLTEILEE